MKSVRKGVARRALTERARKNVADAQTFAKIFSRSGAVSVAGIANREIKAAKSRLRKLGIDPEDPRTEHDDPNFKLS